MPTKLGAPREFLKQRCRPCLIFIKFCYFDDRINKPVHMFSLLDLRFVRCSHDLDVCITCAKGSQSFFYLITYKSMTLENPIARYVSSYLEVSWTWCLVNATVCLAEWQEPLLETKNIRLRYNSDFCLGWRLDLWQTAAKRCFEHFSVTFMGQTELLNYHMNCQLWANAFWSCLIFPIRTFIISKLSKELQAVHNLARDLFAGS